MIHLLTRCRKFSSPSSFALPEGAFASNRAIRALRFRDLSAQFIDELATLLGVPKVRHFGFGYLPRRVAGEGLGDRVHLNLGLVAHSV